jgi:hypothetical protein
MNEPRKWWERRDEDLPLPSRYLITDTELDQAIGGLRRGGVSVLYYTPPMDCTSVLWPIVHRVQEQGMSTYALLTQQPDIHEMCSYGVVPEKLFSNVCALAHDVLHRVESLKNLRCDLLVIHCITALFTDGQTWFRQQDLLRAVAARQPSNTAILATRVLPQKSSCGAQWQSDDELSMIVVGERKGKAVVRIMGTHSAVAKKDVLI